MAAGLACVVSLMGASPAVAQLATPDTEIARGITAGAFKIWPWLSVEAGYDSNIFYLSEDDPQTDASEGVQDSPLLLVKPGIRFENPNYRDVHLRMELSGGWRQYFSDDKNVETQSDFMADADMTARFFPKSMVGFDVFDSFTHRLDTPNFSSNQSLSRIVNRAGGRFSVHPGGVDGNRAVDVSVEYSYDIERFADFGNLDRDMHRFKLLGSWKFFPKTALVLDATVGVRSWAQPEAAYGRINSMPVRVKAGLHGAVTRRFDVVMNLGWGQGLYESGEDFGSVVGDMRVQWRPQRTSSLGVAYRRNFVDSFYGSFYRFDAFEFDAKQRLWDRVELSGSVGYHLLDYADFVPSETLDPQFVTVTVNDPERVEHALVGNLRFAVDVARFLSLEATYSYRQVFSDFLAEGTTAAGENTVFDAGGYTRHAILGGVRIQY
jgi:hypothetical protein